MELFFFYFFGALAIVSALGVILLKNPVSSALSLVLSFFAIASLYAMLHAHFLAVIQVLVYAGAIMVLFVFVMMLLNLQEKELEEKALIRPAKIGIGTLASLLGAFLVYRFFPLRLENQILGESFGTVKGVGIPLFKDYLLPFELISLLLVVGIVGSILLAKRKI